MKPDQISPNVPANFQVTSKDINPQKNPKENPPGPGCLTWIAENKYINIVLNTLGHKGTKIAAGALFSVGIIVTAFGGPAGVALLITALALLAVSASIDTSESPMGNHSERYDIIGNGLDGTYYFLAGMFPMISIPVYLIGNKCHTVSV